ncbi:MAG TPA: CRTAC1 family protein [Vicinamibacterales bacterium]|nr:CRTAC1 family protein [Vicinamibacterales bacterium]
MAAAATPRVRAALGWCAATACCTSVFVAAGQEAPQIFLDRTAETGLHFTHVNGAAGELLLPEVIGSGGALFDYDNDGDLDLLAVQGSALTGASGAGEAPRSRLFRNELEAPGGRIRFSDVTARSRLDAPGYGMGAAAADFDNDGWVDLYVYALGSNRLFRNNGDGTFTDVTGRTRTDDPRWSTSATFFDYDRDGWLDLFVVNYVKFSAEMKRACFSPASARDYCHPSVYEPVADRLFRNAGDGTFIDVTTRAGIGQAPARGLGVLAADINNDGWTDLYVANDGDPNQLWLNERGSGRFTDGALLAGVALDRMGRPQGSMGVDAGDVDGDGDEDLFVTNLDNEGNTLYVNQGKGLFEDRTAEAGLFVLGFTGFGTRMFDYDNDGWLDLAVVNGAVRHLPAQVRVGDPYPLKQRSQLFRNRGRGRFTEVRSGADAFSPRHVSRGLAAGDLDNDGDVDLVVFNNSGPVRVLLNQVGSRQHWLGLRVVDGPRRRDALQARIELVGRRGARAVRRVQTDGSYASASDPRVVFGLGTDASPQAVRVQWPDGRVEEFGGLQVDRYWVIESGKPVRPMVAGAR